MDNSTELRELQYEHGVYCAQEKEVMRQALQKIAAYRSRGELDTPEKIERHEMIHTARTALKEAARG